MHGCYTASICAGSPLTPPSGRFYIRKRSPQRPNWWVWSPLAMSCVQNSRSSGCEYTSYFWTRTLSMQDIWRAASSVYVNCLGWWLNGLRLFCRSPERNGVHLKYMPLWTPTVVTGCPSTNAIATAFVEVLHQLQSQRMPAGGLWVPHMSQGILSQASFQVTLRCSSWTGESCRVWKDVI